jgi:hypothetical protein
MNFFRSMEIDPTCKFSPLNRGPEESPSMGSLHLDVFTQPRPKADIWLIPLLPPLRGSSAQHRDLRFVDPISAHEVYVGPIGQD